MKYLTTKQYADLTEKSVRRINFLLHSIELMEKNPDEETPARIKRVMDPHFKNVREIIKAGRERLIIMKDV